MCTSTITVKNPIRQFIQGIDKQHLQVPCGKCWECRTRKRSDYFVRAFFETLESQTSGGFAYFLTLTYSDDYLPLFAYQVKDGYKSVPVFAPHHVRTYLDRCKSALRRKFGKDAVNNHVRYFLTSEYGSDEDYIDDRGHLRRATHRPHYHMIWFVSSPINRYIFREIVNESWIAGRTYDSDINDGFIDGLGAVGYVAKYVSKDFDQMLEDITILHQIPDYCKKDFVKFARPIIRLSSAHTKENITVLGFGECALRKNPDGTYKYHKYVSDSLLLDGYILCPDSETTTKKYPLPMYLQRKLFYDKLNDIKFDDDGNKHYSGLYYLNDYGRKMKLHRLKAQAQALKNRVTFLLNYTPVDETSFLKLINKRLTISKQFQTYESLRQHFQTIDDFSRDVCDFYLGAIVYRGYGYNDAPDYLTKVTPVEDYLAVLSYDRRTNNMTDFAPDGTMYQDVLADVQSHVKKYNTDFVNILDHIFDVLVNEVGNIKETKHVRLELLQEQRNKYLKHLKKRNYYVKKRNHSA